MCSSLEEIRVHQRSHRGEGRDGDNHPLKILQNETF